MVFHKKVKSGAKKVQRLFGYGLTPSEKQERYERKMESLDRIANYEEKRARLERARADIRMARSKGQPKRMQLSPEGSIFNPSGMFNIPDQFSGDYYKKPKKKKKSKGRSKEEKYWEGKRARTRKQAPDLFDNVFGV